MTLSEQKALEISHALNGVFPDSKCVIKGTDKPNGVIQVQLNVDSINRLQFAILGLTVQHTDVDINMKRSGTGISISLS
jgi:hypothetical protein